MKEQILLTSLEPLEIQRMIHAGVEQALTSQFDKLTPPQKEQDEYLSRKEALQLLKISSTSLWSRMKEGALPYMRIGRKVLFSKNKLLASISGKGVK